MVERPPELADCQVVSVKIIYGRRILRDGSSLLMGSEILSRDYTLKAKEGRNTIDIRNCDALKP